MEDQNADSPELKINWFIMEIKGTKEINENKRNKEIIQWWSTENAITWNVTEL